MGNHFLFFIDVLNRATIRTIIYMVNSKFLKKRGEKYARKSYIKT
jgi:hypothetical protein